MCTKSACVYISSTESLFDTQLSYCIMHVQISEQGVFTRLIDVFTGGLHFHSTFQAALVYNYITCSLCTVYMNMQ